MRTWLALVLVLAATIAADASRLFTATTHYVSVASDTSSDLHSAFMLCAWVYPTAAPATNGMIIQHGGHQTTTPNEEWHLSVTGTGAVSVTASSFGVASSATLVTTSAWNDICGSWDGTTLRTYVNGTASTTAGATGTITHLSNLTEYGASSLAVWSGFHFVGRIAETGVWSTADANIPTRFHQRVSPLKIRRDILKSYRPLLGQSPEVDYFNPFTGTVNGATLAPHPSVSR